MKAMEHKKSFHSKKPPVCTVAPDGYEINEPGSTFSFFRPPSSTDDRVIVPVILTNFGNTKFIPDEYCTMPEQLKKLDIDPNLWSNWATNMKERAATLPVYGIGPIWKCLFSVLLGCPCVCYMMSHNANLLEKFKEEALIELNKNVLKSEGVRDAKLQQAECTVGSGDNSVSQTIHWLTIPLTDADAAVLNQANWQYRYRNRSALLEEIPKGEICPFGNCICLCFEIPCGLYYY